MSDASIAEVARRLARALNEFARTRSNDTMKAIGILHTELCAAVRTETEDKILADAAAAARGEHS